MKEFKFDVDGDGIAIPVIRCETQREFNRTIASYRTGGKLSTNDPDGEVIYIIYKDGSTFYHNSADVSLNEGKYKRTGILRGVSSNPDGYEVFGDFAIDEYGNIVIDDKLIEEYGVYAGQYDVKEQDEQEVWETVEQTETETNETTVTKYTNKELVEIYKNLKTSARIIGFASASDCEMMVAIELEAVKRHLNLIDGTVEETAEESSEVETVEQVQEKKDTFEYRNYIISGNERTGIIAIDNHGNFSPKVYKTVEEAKKAVDEDIEYAEKKYAEMEAEQTEVEETAETETEEDFWGLYEKLRSELLDSEECDSGFEYYSVKVAYEAMKDKKRSIVFMNYSEALEVAEHFTETWGGEKAIVIAVNFVIRNDRQPESERDKMVLETETAEIEMRCVPYNYLGLRGYVSIEDKQIVNEDIA